MTVPSFSAMSGFLGRIHRVLTFALSWLGILFAGMVPKSGRLHRFYYTLIHFVFIGALAILLGWKSRDIVAESKVDIPNQIAQFLPQFLEDGLRRYFCGVTFVVVVAIIRMCCFFYEVYRSTDFSEFDDINRAWEAGLDAMAREGFDIQWLPIFLVNGASAEQQKSIFEGSKIAWKVSCSPEDPRFSVLSFQVCDEGLFICLNDVGAMSRQIKKVPSRGGPATRSSNPAAQATMRPGEMRAMMQATSKPEDIHAAAGRTLPPGGVKAAIAAATMPPAAPAQYGATMKPGAVMRALETSDKAAAPVAASPMILEKLTKQEMELNRRRLEHFCQLLSVERGSYCPINGLLQVIPLRWSESNAHKDLAEAAKEDLQTLHSTLHLRFPVVCMHAGLEDVTGLTEFIERGKEVDSRFRDSRAGSRFPVGLAIDEKTSNWVIERGMIWFRDWVYAEFEKGLANSKNRLLYQFLCALSLRRDRLIRELRTIASELRLQQPVRLTGCYFAATGADSSRQAFVQGVVQRIISDQNDVAWLPEWISRNNRSLFIATVLAGLFLVISAVDLWFLYQIFSAWSNE